MAGETTTGPLQAAMDKSIEDLKAIMEQSIVYQTETTRITTALGQVATRAAKQTPQG